MQGNTLNIELLSPRGEVLGYREAGAALGRAGFHIRVGCTCNPGACYEMTGGHMGSWEGRRGWPAPVLHGSLAVLYPPWRCSRWGLGSSGRHLGLGRWPLECYAAVMYIHGLLARPGLTPTPPSPMPGAGVRDEEVRKLAEELAGHYEDWEWIWVHRWVQQRVERLKVFWVHSGSYTS